MHEGNISIWFFIGISLLTNGVLIVQAGIREILQPPAQSLRLKTSASIGSMLARKRGNRQIDEPQAVLTKEPSQLDAILTDQRHRPWWRRFQ